MESNEFAMAMREAALKERFSYSDIQPVRSAIERYVNRYGVNAVETAQELCSDSAVRPFATDLAIAWVRYWTNGEHHWVDERNERQTMICREIAGTSGFGKLHAAQKRSDEIVSSIGVSTHRTLVQSMSAIFFNVLALAYPRIGQEMEDMYGNRWFRSPMV